MKVFVSGSTGFIGSRLTLRLAEEGHNVHALYRSTGKTARIDHPGVSLFRGDITDETSLEKGLTGCDQAFHCAAFTHVWEKDHGMVYRLNIEGTVNVVSACQRAGVKRIVITSSAGVFGPSSNNPVDEETTPESFFTDYEYSKFILEKVLSLFARTGIDIVVVNPTRVYGPGPLNESNGVTRMIERYCRGKWHFLPGDGKSTGNYVYIDDVVDGHILAMEKGIKGQRYILGGEDASYECFFELLAGISGKKYRLYNIPRYLLLPVAGLMVSGAQVGGGNPLITPALVNKFTSNFSVSSDKAKKELGYRPLSLEDGLTKTVEWILQNKK